MIVSAGGVLNMESANRAFGLAWITFLLVWIAAVGFSKPQARTTSAVNRIVYSMILLAGFLLIFDRRIQIGWLRTPIWHTTLAVAFTGAAVTWAGVLFAIWARFTLGSNWSGQPMVKVNHELVVKGPYRLVRHPIYTGLFFAGLGSVILVGRWCVVPGIILVFIGLMMKMAQEERLMTETFPAAYPDYRGRVKALIPFVF
ncbi:MAG TPA: isoprenylcysteine carboxylmethyltransferase family protein [Terracidiphilus sp.]|nr:isoprenylcysteine carboxylmethyltransferase family protein [Terracidiphilus sp.]